MSVTTTKTKKNKCNAQFVWTRCVLLFSVLTPDILFGILIWKNHVENVHQKLVPDLFLSLVSQQKGLLHAINSFENKIY